MLMPS